MDVATLRQILCPARSSAVPLTDLAVPKSSFSSVSNKLIIHAYRRLLSLINTTEFTELTIEELNGKPTFIEELIAVYMDMDILSLQQEAAFSPCDLAQFIVTCVVRDLTLSITDYIGKEHIRDLLIRYIVKDLLVLEESSAPLLPDQLIFIDFISSIESYLSTPEVAKALIMILCHDLEQEIIDPDGSTVDLSLMEDQDGLPTSLWDVQSRQRLDLTLSVLSRLYSKTSGCARQYVAEYCSSLLLRLIFQLFHNRRELMFVLDGVAPSAAEEVYVYAEGDYDLDEDILGISRGKDKAKRSKESHMDIKKYSESPAMRAYQVDLSKWIDIRLRDLYSLLLHGFGTFPYIIQRPRTPNKVMNTVYGSDGRAKVVEAETDRGLSLLTVHQREVCSLLPSKDPSEQLLGVLLLEAYYMSISPIIPAASMGLGKAFHPSQFVKTLRPAVLMTPHSVHIDVKNRHGKDRKGKNVQNPSSNTYADPFNLIMDNLRTLEMLRPIEMSLTMTDLSKSGSIRLLVWFLLHEVEEIRFRVGRIFREILDNPGREEQEIPSRKEERKVSERAQTQTEIMILITAIVEQALVPVLEMVSRGIAVTTTDRTYQFPEVHIRSLATDLLFATTNSLERKDDHQSVNKKGSGKTSSHASSLSKRMLNTLLNTQNPILKKNIFASLLFLSARSTVLPSKIWEASRRVQASGPAGGLLRELFEGMLPILCPL